MDMTKSSARHCPVDTWPFPRPSSPVVRDYLRAGLRVNFPPPGFDPLTESDERLEEFFLPPRPDTDRAPQARASWEEAMRGPHIWPKLENPENLVDELFEAVDLRSHPRLAGPAHSGFEQASANWSGAYVRPPDFSKAVGVHGAWTVPGPAAPGGIPGDYVSSTWIGLDGHDPASRSLPQLGTWQSVSRTEGGQTTQDIHAWWQWYVRGAATNGSVTIKPFPVSPGDVVFAIVRKLTDTSVHFYLHNRTGGNSFPFLFEGAVAAGVFAPPGVLNPLTVRVEGRTAEWILERPAHLEDPLLYQLPDYGGAAFVRCIAETDSTALLQEVDLERARLMRMVDWELPPAPSGVVSTPERDGPTGVKLHYGP
jgi:Peptidase A4 family